jgi:tetraacyldisaccharide 4'-kinase
VFAHAVRARRRWYERHPEAVRQLDAPVISVGNLSIGGTGKTPVVRHIAEWLVRRGERPAILSRGYGRHDAVEGVTVVADGGRVLSDFASAGDEPLMLAQSVPGAVVAVAEDRYLAGALAERQLGATVHVLDDGFQHLRLARDLNVLVTAPGEITGGRVLPFGRLREPSDAAARADVVVVMNADAAAARAEAWALGISQSLGARRVIPPAMSPQPAVAVAGIAHPDQFFDALQRQGWQLADRIGFRDHHCYSAADIAAIAARAQAAGACDVLTTDKDAVRLAACGPLPFTLHPIPLRIEFDAWPTLAQCIEAAIERRRAGRMR